MDIDSGNEPSIDTLTEALADIGNNWERVPLKHADGRTGWQEALIGCLKDVCLSNFSSFYYFVNYLSSACDCSILP